MRGSSAGWPHGDPSGAGEAWSAIWWCVKKAVEAGQDEGVFEDCPMEENDCLKEEEGNANGEEAP